MSHWDFGRTEAGQRDDLEPPASGHAGLDEEPGWDDNPGPYPITYERDPYFTAAPPTEVPRRDGSQAPPLFFTGEPGALDPDAEGDAPPGTGRLPDADGQADAGGPPGPADWDAWAGTGGGQWRRRPNARRWVLPAGIAVTAAALGAAATLLVAGHHPAASARLSPVGSQTAPSRLGTPSSQTVPSSPGTAGSAAASPTAPPASSPATIAADGAPLTLAQAQAVVTQYTAANNRANAARSDTGLAAIETGSSYAIDAGQYQAGRAAKSAPYPAFGPLQSTYYIPRGESGFSTRWFVVEVANAFASSPRKVSSTEYLLFTEPPGGTWREAIEPYLLTGASVPRIALGADGLATAIGPDASGDAVAPGQLPAATAASLNGTAAGLDQVADPGNLADQADQRSWDRQVPQGKVTDQHAPATGADGAQLALRTAGGGALVFFTDEASLTVTPPAGSVLHVTVPGFYSASQSLTRVGLTYLEQFAAYDPPSGGGAPRVVGDYSAITGTN